MCNIDMWFDIWRGNLVFSFIGVHVVDSGTSSVLHGKMAHLSTIEAWSFGFAWLVCLDCMYLILSCIFFIILGSVGSWLAWSIVELVSIVETVIWEPRASYVHWDQGVIVLSGHIGQVVLGYVISLLRLVLSSSREEGLTLPLLSECVLECAGWLYSTVGAYAFNELFCFSDVDCTLFDINVVCDKGWFHDVF